MTNNIPDDNSAGDDPADDSAATPSDEKPSTAHVFMEDTEEDIEWPAETAPLRHVGRGLGRALRLHRGRMWRLPMRRRTP